MKKYTDPDKNGCLFEAKVCEKVVKDLEAIRKKYQKKVGDSATKRQTDIAAAMEYRSEGEIQDAYGYDCITEEQYDLYLELFRKGKEALENPPISVEDAALKIIQKVIQDIDEDRRSWEFSALSPEQQEAERKRSEESQNAWKNKIAEIKKRQAEI